MVVNIRSCCNVFQSASLGGELLPYAPDAGLASLDLCQLFDKSLPVCAEVPFLWCTMFEFALNQIFREGHLTDWM